MGGKYFDERYGSGAPGYVKGPANYFDYDAFGSGRNTFYINPRTGNNIQSAHPTSGARFSIWDIIVPINPFVGALSLGISKIKK